MSDEQAYPEDPIPPHEEAQTAHIGIRCIHIQWEGPYSLEEVTGLQDEGTDYGIYQIYGPHTVYGGNVLLYIGMAAQQTFGIRISQHPWEYNIEGNIIQVYVGRLSGPATPSDDVWEREITWAEQLLIHAHFPACNCQHIHQIDNDICHIHVFNWGIYRDLLPEASGMRWTTHFNRLPSYHAYGSHSEGQ